MKHSEWTARHKEAMALASERPSEAAAMLVDLASHADRAQREGLDDWHQQQALGMAADALEGSGDLPGALGLYRRTLDLCQAHSAYWTIATANMLATVALLQFRLGQDEDGTKSGQEALQYLGRVPYAADSMLARVVKELADRGLKGGSAEE
jgi:hypothetical protein